MKRPPFLAYQVCRAHGDAPAWLVRAVTVLRLDVASRRAHVSIYLGHRVALMDVPFDELRSDRRAAGELLAEKLIASPAAGESAVNGMAGRAQRAPAAA
jgi:hypothetical protein